MTIFSDSADNTDKAAATPQPGVIPAIYQTRLFAALEPQHTIWNRYARRKDEKVPVYFPCFDEKAPLPFLLTSKGNWSPERKGVRLNLFNST